MKTFRLLFLLLLVSKFANAKTTFTYYPDYLPHPYAQNTTTQEWTGKPVVTISVSRDETNQVMFDGFKYMVEEKFEHSSHVGSRKYYSVRYDSGLETGLLAAQGIVSEGQVLLRILVERIENRMSFESLQETGTQGKIFAYFDSPAVQALIEKVANKGNDKKLAEVGNDFSGGFLAGSRSSTGGDSKYLEVRQDHNSSTYGYDKSFSCSNKSKLSSRKGCIFSYKTP